MYSIDGKLFPKREYGRRLEFVYELRGAQKGGAVRALKVIKEGSVLASYVHLHWGSAPASRRPSSGMPSWGKRNVLN